jgi:hypothetical protein
MKPFTYREVRQAALSLKEEQRAELADALQESLEGEVSTEQGAIWQRRLEELESGKVRGIPIEESIATARAALKKHVENKNTSRRRRGGH